MVRTTKPNLKQTEGFNLPYKFPVLTNDPSLTAWGWAVLDGKTILEVGCIKTEPSNKKQRIRAGDDRTRRISEITNVLIPLIQKYNIKYVLSELPHGSQSYSSAVMVGMVPGILQTLADCFELGIEWYSEADSKKCALGKSSAEKSEMVEKIKTIYPISDWYCKTKYKDEAIADALAVHYVASKQSSTLKAFMK